MHWWKQNDANRTDITKLNRLYNSGYRCSYLPKWICTLPAERGWNNQTNRLSVKVANTYRTEVWYDTGRIPSYCIEILRPYLGGTNFIVKADHDPLQWNLNLMECTDRLTGWRLRLLEFAFEVVYTAGTKDQSAETLSHLPTGGEDSTPLQVYFSLLEKTRCSTSATNRCVWSSPLSTKRHPCKITAQKFCLKHQQQKANSRWKKQFTLSAKVQLDK